MIKKLIHAVVASALLFLSLSVYAIMYESQAEATVKAMLDDGASASEIVGALVEDGRSLQDATAVAVVSTLGGTQIDMAEAGICAALDIAQAERVGQAAVNVVEDDYQVDAIERVVAAYTAGECINLPSKQKNSPSSYETTGTVSGGGSVSPSN